MYFELTCKTPDEEKVVIESSPEAIETMLGESDVFPEHIRASFQALYAHERGKFTRLLKQAMKNTWGGNGVRSDIQGLAIRIHAGQIERKKPDFTFPTSSESA